jgi:hypothetical protein
MQKRFVAITLLTVLLLVSCATTPEKPDFPPFKIGDLILSKTIQKTDTSATPINIANSFISTDTMVVASIKLEGLTGFHELRWEWYDPKGEHFLSSGNYAIRTSEGKYKRTTTAWHKLSIKGARAMNLPGTWHVKLFFDGNSVTEKNFTIE